MLGRSPACPCTVSPQANGMGALPHRGACAPALAPRAHSSEPTPVPPEIGRFPSAPIPAPAPTTPTAVPSPPIAKARARAPGAHVRGPGPCATQPCRWPIPAKRCRGHPLVLRISLCDGDKMGRKSPPRIRLIRTAGCLQHDGRLEPRRNRAGKPCRQTARSELAQTLRGHNAGTDRVEMDVIAHAGEMSVVLNQGRLVAALKDMAVLSVKAQQPRREG